MRVARSRGARGTKVVSARGLVFAVVGLIVIAAGLLAPGIFFLVQRETGARGVATVDSCDTTGAGKYERTECSGTWVVGGSLLDKGSIVVGTIQGAEDSDVGKTIDVTLAGDEAYSRDPTLPLVLIGFGLVAIAFAILIVIGYFRQPRGAVTATGGGQVPDGGASGKWRVK
jgi:hypothetical protein